MVPSVLYEFLKRQGTFLDDINAVLTQLCPVPATERTYILYRNKTDRVNTDAIMEINKHWKPRAVLSTGYGMLT